MNEANLNSAAEQLERIAHDHLGLETLEDRNMDSLDFHDLGVASIRKALAAAYAAGQAAAKAEQNTALVEIVGAFATGSYGTARQARALRTAKKAIGA